ncbi:MAG: DUF1109 domain-containing protein [Xanthobacteraceae bacterium]|nr:DUF1109 domain-containing protein [Xanthobacteraceae bacterium]
MRTDDLIEMLSTNVEPVTRHGHVEIRRIVLLTIAASATAAIGSTVLLFGVRPDLANFAASAFLALKMLFAVGVIAVASLCLARLARPGGERTVSTATAVLPVAAVVALAAGSLFLTSPAHWNQAVVGHHWLECVLSIPLIAVIPMAATFWVVRRMAPTDLVQAGALAGMVAGGVGAAGYALHCTDDSLPFIAVWYGGAIALCALVGAVVGPRLLRW